MTRQTLKAQTVATKTVSVPFDQAAALGKADLDAALQVLPQAQQERIAAVAARNRGRGEGVKMALKQEVGNLGVSYTHENTNAAALLLMADLATLDPNFFNGITGQIARIGAHGARVDEANSNFLLSVVRAVQPRDELETLLAVQMGAVHAATLMMARRLNHVETIPQQDAAARAFTRLARTFAMQLEALNRHRTGGQQRVTVEHVTVNAGGQAIVGAVAAGGGGAQ